MNEGVGLSPPAGIKEVRDHDALAMALSQAPMAESLSHLTLMLDRSPNPEDAADDGPYTPVVGRLLADGFRTAPRRESGCDGDRPEWSDGTSKIAPGRVGSQHATGWLCRGTSRAAPVPRGGATGHLYAAEILRRRRPNQGSRKGRADLNHLPSDDGSLFLPQVPAHLPALRAFGLHYNGNQHVRQTLERMRRWMQGAAPLVRVAVEFYYTYGTITTPVPITTLVECVGALATVAEEIAVEMADALLDDDGTFEAIARTVGRYPRSGLRCRFRLILQRRSPFRGLPRTAGNGTGGNDVFFLVGVGLGEWWKRSSMEGGPRGQNWIATVPLGVQKH